MSTAPTITVIKAKAVIDATGAKPIENAAVIVEGSVIKAVERQVIEACLAKGIPPRAEIESVDGAKYYLDLGVKHFCLGTDIMILYSWIKENGEKLQKTISDY